ncbi:hypothetical protein [Clostridium sp. KNHs216]|uniref:hypothetical protein n=1 Tax=Clostridium sp. KNHs216 TaxID=1550235 RepID=UPI0011521EE3|nr:hypothetical protein [Clostridium sp. KNHs216]TQI68538.1 hypothetical protein LY85_3277 [Clostridium sp. KNHs216]
MKRIISLMLCVIIVFSIPCAASADGDGNMDGGGGDMGSGTNNNIWHDGEDGVRVTIIRASDNKAVSLPIDLTNKNESGILPGYHFGKVCKMQYRNGTVLYPSSSKYYADRPSVPLPKIISDRGNANITEIKKYFCSEWALKNIASIIGASYNTLVNGNYKLLIEPIAYFTFQGNKFAMTATEAALYDQKLSGGLRSKMVSLTHQNLPLSLFLERSDLGFAAYTGSTSKAQSDATIISYLGLGIVKFKPDSDGEDDEGDDSDASSATYRVNTDVITSVTLSTNSEITPNSPASVTFHILGGSYTVNNIVIPENESQLVWVKWHTPSTPQDVNISVTSSKGSLDHRSISAKIESLIGHEPPDPTAKDRNNSFIVPDIPNQTERTASSWGIWNAEWIPVWVWHENWVWVDHPDWPSGGEWEDHGKWVDEGYWEYSFTSYHATLSANMTIFPDDKSPTATGKQMRSGYGIKETVDTLIRSSAPSSHITGAQTAITYFPEFLYKTYWRQLDLLESGESSVFQFQNNIYSTYNRRVHFTPVWFPDTSYKAYTYLEDAWTPAGMLCLNLNDSVTINGSVYDDWHIGPKLVD